jgi:hypothetical protein
VYEPRPTTPTRRDAVYEPRPAPTQADIAYDPRPATPPPTRADVAYDPRPAPTQAEIAYDPRPAPPPPTRQDVAYTRTPAPAQQAPASAELSAVSMIELADRLATALRVLKGDLRLALWLFDHAGGGAYAQAFVDQTQRAQQYPDDPLEQARLLQLAPAAARLLEAAIMLANVVSSIEPNTGPDEEAQPNAANLDPVPRA